MLLGAKVHEERLKAERLKAEMFEGKMPERSIPQGLKDRPAVRFKPFSLQSFSFFSDDGQALAAFAAAGGEHLATASGGLTSAETDLAGAFLAVGAECRLHDYVEKRGSR
jgi:hypothetical protein